MNDATMLVDFVPEVVLTGTLDDIATFVRFERNRTQNLNKYIFIKKIYNEFEFTFYKGLVILFFYAVLLFFTACQPGYYGRNCSLLCLPNCKTCRHTDGLCSCRAGWTGHNCSIGKLEEKYYLCNAAKG